MSKRILESYALSVCFVSVGCFSIFSGVLLYSLVEISLLSVIKPLYPPSLPIFSQNGVITAPAFPAQEIQNNTERNRGLEEQQKRFEENQEERMKVELIKNIVRSIIIVFIASLIFIFHWRIGKDARSSET